MQAKAPYADCINCPLQSRPFCPSSIPSNATMIVIGDAPGTQEIIERVPFVGDSGDVLRGALTYVGVDWQRVAKTNAVLCRSYSDGTPDAAIKACGARLMHDINKSGASTIIAAGNVAAQAVDMLAGYTGATGGIMSRAGKTYPYSEQSPLHATPRMYTTVVNPAFLLRNDDYAPQYLRQLELAVNPRLRNFNIADVKLAVMNNDNKSRIIQYLNMFDRGSPMAFDVETDHLQWYDTPSVSAAILLCLVITLEDWRSVIIPAHMLNDTSVREAVLMCFSEYHIIAQNGKFDQNVMRARCNIDFTLDDDTMLMHYALYELGTHGLKDLATQYLGTPDYEAMYVDDWFTAHGIKKIDRRYSLLPLDNLYPYAAIDGAVTLQLWRIFKADLDAKGLYEYPYKRVLLELANSVPAIEQCGIGIDRQQLTLAGVDFANDISRLEAELTAIILPMLAQLPDTHELKRLMRGKRKAERNTFTYNPKSNPQTHYVLYDPRMLGLKLTKRLITATATNTGKEALEALPAHPFIDILRHYRRIVKMHDTYIASIQRRATLDDILHVDFRLTGTEIGRLSASGGDHGIPRADDYYGAVIRSAFIAHPTDANEVLVVVDYSQAELRAFADRARVQFLIDKYRAGVDVHTETALMLEQYGAIVFQGFQEAMNVVNNAHMCTAEAVARAKAFMKRVRVLAKNINFGNIYGGGASGISGMIGGAISTAAIGDVLKVYHTIMPEAAEYATKQFELLKRQGYVETVFKRRRRFYVISDANRDEAKKAVVHMVVAGSAADCSNLSAAILVKSGVRICHMNHDSLIARATRNEANDVARFMQQTMIRVASDAMPLVPWQADVETDNGAFARRWVPIPDRSAYDARGKPLA